MTARILPPALWMLYRLSVRARLRKIGRGCRTVRGVLALLAVLVLFGFWMMSFFIQRSQLPVNPGVVREYVPLGMFAMCLLNLLFSKTGEGIAFRPAEVEFLFPAPFRRRELLLYRIIGNSLVLLPTGLMLSMFVYPYVTFWLAGFVGAYLALQFFMMFQMVVGLLAGSVRQRLYSRARLVIAFAVMLVLVASLVMTLGSSPSGFSGRIAEIQNAWPAKVVLFPFKVFGSAMAAASLGQLAAWGLAGCGLNVLLAGLVLGLDLDYREASVRASQRIQERLQSARRGRVHWMSGAVNVRRFRYIGVPRLGGAGPIASYQLTMALRSAKGLLPFLLIMLVATGMPMLLISRSTVGNVLAPIAAPLLMFLLIVFPQFLQFDFRGDVDRMDLVKTLPLRPVAVACGQLLTPVFALLLIELLLTGGLVMAGMLPARLLLLVLVFLPPVNLMVFAVENMIWLLYPYRMAVAGAADLQAIVRQMLLMFLKMFILALVFGAAAGVGGIAWLISSSVRAGFVAAWCAGAGACAALVPLVAWAFQRFDPASDSPA